jgi:predicted nucleic acid-binding protein
MAKISFLVDTDVVIEYLNSGQFTELFDLSHHLVYYSVITKKELLAKSGLREQEREAILLELRRWRMIPMSEKINVLFSKIRRQHPSLEKADALIAATALVKNLPLVTRKKKHFRIVSDLRVFGA